MWCSLGYRSDFGDKLRWVNGLRTAKRKWLVVVEISATLFQPARSGSHLYPAPLHPVRSRTLSSRSYTTLVGLATPLLPCFPLCAFIIAYIWLFVKHFFCQVLYFSEKILGENLVKRSQWTRTTIRSAQICNAESNRFASRNQSRTSFVPLLYHNLGDLSRGFLKFFSRKLRAGRLGHTQPLPTVRHLAWVSQLPRCSLPLTMIVYHRPHQKSIGNVAQIRDLQLFDFC